MIGDETLVGYFLQKGGDVFCRLIVLAAVEADTNTRVNQYTIQPARLSECTGQRIPLASAVSFWFR